MVARSPLVRSASDDLRTSLVVGEAAATEEEGSTVISPVNPAVGSSAATKLVLWSAVRDSSGCASAVPQES